ncbi:MAG TPA: hypothetical protein PKE49_05795 [Leptospiraceae bacterium]|nr:hypothetical protein [Leptospiraceae bacterium]HMW58744.1 hypothetical protein [Leptospiraceae bacterium]HMX56016.1 hypothetical protein [Leptospiraceae bacterium]HNE23573.1 hypothetical protein [Leptospiraceae bacterium]HNJ34308.1 hypothetical protein [Leptospiraceae bacterium]
MAGTAVKSSRIRLSVSIAASSAVARSTDVVMSTCPFARMMEAFPFFSTWMWRTMQRPRPGDGRLQAKNLE